MTKGTLGYFYLGGKYIESGVHLGYYGYLSTMRLVMMLPNDFIDSVFTLDTIMMIRKVGENTGSDIIVNDSLAAATIPKIAFSTGGRGFKLLCGSSFSSGDDISVLNGIKGIIPHGSKYRIRLKLIDEDPEKVFTAIDSFYANEKFGGKSLFYDGYRSAEKSELSMMKGLEIHDKIANLPYGYTRLSFSEYFAGGSLVVPETVQILDLSNLNTDCKVLLNARYLPTGLVYLGVPTRNTNKIKIRVLSNSPCTSLVLYTITSYNEVFNGDIRVTLEVGKNIKIQRPAIQGLEVRTI